MCFVNNLQISLSTAKFSAYASVASANFTTGTVTIPIDTVAYTSGSSDFTISSNVITVGRAMLALVSYNASIDVTSIDHRTACRLDLKQTALSGSGFSIVRGATSFTYNRNPAQGEGSASVSLIVAFAVDDELYVEVSKEQATSANMATIADACSVSIVEI